MRHPLRWGLDALGHAVSVAEERVREGAEIACGFQMFRRRRLKRCGRYDCPQLRAVGGVVGEFAQAGVSRCRAATADLRTTACTTSRAWEELQPAERDISTCPWAGAPILEPIRRDGGPDFDVLSTACRDIAACAVSQRLRNRRECGPRLRTLRHRARRLIARATLSSTSISRRAAHLRRACERFLPAGERELRWSPRCSRRRRSRSICGTAAYAFSPAEAIGRHLRRAAGERAGAPAAGSAGRAGDPRARHSCESCGRARR